MSIKFKRTESDMEMFCKINVFFKKYIILHFIYAFNCIEELMYRECGNFSSIQTDYRNLGTSVNKFQIPDFIY